jgi:threonine/homoserine/homoserine lactone efflux protein
VIHFLSIGMVLGLSAGFAPGPLLTLVISESLQYGIRAGVKVALAPVISDLPIILLTLFIASRLSGFHFGLGVISLAGGVFIFVTGINCMRPQPLQAPAQTEPPKSLLKGVVANVLNPHPYLFWISVGAPTISKAAAVGTMAVAAFIGGFYIMLVGSKILLAVAVGRSRSFLKGKLYLNTLRFLGLLLCLFALILFRDGGRLLGLI